VQMSGKQSTAVFGTRRLVQRGSSIGDQKELVARQVSQRHAQHATK
jgi:hypothetical protein